MSKWIIFHWFLHFFFCFKGTKFRVSSPSILPIAVPSNKEAEVQKIKALRGACSVQSNQEPLTWSYVRNTLRKKITHTLNPPKFFLTVENLLWLNCISPVEREIFFSCFTLIFFPKEILRKAFLPLLSISLRRKGQFFSTNMILELVFKWNIPK